MSILDSITGLTTNYWHILAPIVPIVGVAIHAFRRRPKSSPAPADGYFTDTKLLSPPLTRPAYSDRMAYVLAEMSDLAYFQFEGQIGLVEDTLLQAKSLNLSTDVDIRKFLDEFSANLMDGRRLNLKSFSGVLEKSGFQLLDIIHVAETQGFVCKRTVANEPPYLVLAFRGTEKKVSDWLTDARCMPTMEGNAKVHTGFLEAFDGNTNGNGRTAKQVVKDVLDGPEAKDNEGRLLPLFITGHSLGGALALLATKLVAPDINGACYTFGAPRVANYEYFRFLKTPVYRVVNSADVVPRVPPGAVMNVLADIAKGLAWLTSLFPPIASLFHKLESFLDKLNGYRHFGDQRYLADVAEGRFQEVRLLTNPPAIDRIVWAWRRVGKSLLVPVKSHSMNIYRQNLRHLANTRNRQGVN